MLEWRRYEGRHLVEALSESDLGELLHNGPAVYRWKVCLVPPTRIGVRPALLHDWIMNRTQCILGHVDATEASHYLRTGECWVGGGGLSSKHRRVLRDMLVRSGDAAYNARLLRDYLKMLEPGLPSLYVGETGSLVTRTRQHMTGESSNLLGYLEAASYKFDDLYLEAVELPAGFDVDPQKKDIRELMEVLAARFALAGLARDPKFSGQWEERK